MIKSFANSKSRRFYEEGKATKFRSMDTEAAEDLLAALEAAISLQDLSPLRSVGLHKLTGDRSGQWAMTVNGPWRICFKFRDGDAYEVEITDYLDHKRTTNLRSVVPCRARRRQIKVSARPDRTFRPDGHMLSNIPPAIGLSVIAPHALYRGMPPILGMVWSPGMMDVHRINAASEAELRQ